VFIDETLAIMTQVSDVAPGPLVYVYDSSEFVFNNNSIKPNKMENKHDTIFYE
jgi:hypothetical protein